MKTLADLLPLGDMRLYDTADPVRENELPQVTNWVRDLSDVMDAVRAKYHFGRGMAAPQLGVPKRLVYLRVDKPLVLVNPEVHALSEDTFEVWDDCMCFPNLLVRVRRHQRITLAYRDEHWKPRKLTAEGPLSELIQHEIDHLNGVLCTMRAIDGQSFRWRP